MAAVSWMPCTSIAYDSDGAANDKNCRRGKPGGGRGWGCAHLGLGQRGSVEWRRVISRSPPPPPRGGCETG